MLRLCFPFRAYARALLLAGCAFCVGVGGGGNSALAQTSQRDIPSTVVSATGSQEKGFGRIVLSFNHSMNYQARQAGNVVIVTFDAPVQADLTRMLAQMQSYVSAARRDPDGKGIRLALSRKVKMVKTDAAGRVFIDLLPEGWQGDPPPLPMAVIEELVKRTRAAEDRVRAVDAAPERRAVPVGLKFMTTPEFSRLFFKLPKEFPVPQVVLEGDMALIKFEQPVEMDLTAIPSESFEIFKDLSIKRAPQTTELQIKLASNFEVKGFAEDDGFIVDFLGAGLAEAKAQASLMPTLPSQPAPTDSAEATPAPPTAPAAASSPVQTPEASAQAAPAPSAPASHQPQIAAVPSQTAEPTVQNKPAMVAELGVGEGSSSQPEAAKASILSNEVQAQVAPVEGGVKLSFKFDIPTPAAIFQRADVLWMMFDNPARMASLPPLPPEIAHSPELSVIDGVNVVRVQLARKTLVSARSDGERWDIVIGQQPIAVGEPVLFTRQLSSDGLSVASANIPMVDRVITIEDPLIQDYISVALAMGPAHSVQKTQRFIDFEVLPTAHGLAVVPRASDVTIRTFLDQVTVSRPSGLLLSANIAEAVQGREAFDPTFHKPWVEEQLARKFREHERMLFGKSAMLEGEERDQARLELARNYIIRNLGVEASALLKNAMQADANLAQNPQWVLARSAAYVLSQRYQEALKMLSFQALDQRPEGAFWRSIAEANVQRWAQARLSARVAEPVVAQASPDLQMLFRLTALKAALNFKDYTEAQHHLSQLEVMPDGQIDKKQIIMYANGRIAEGSGRHKDAIEAYKTATKGRDQNIVHEARYYLTSLKLQTGELNKEQAMNELESLRLSWRGDETELFVLRDLAALYEDTGKVRDAFLTLRRAIEADRYGNQIVRDLQDRMAVKFEALFIGNEADALQPLDALALYYDFKHLTPIGRKGDEMIRRIADRLVQADLLEPAIELLQHQVSHRLSGAARAQVAARLAVVQLAAQRPADALKTIRESRLSDLPQDLRRARSLLEARALAEMGRTGLAVEVLENMTGSDIFRMQADILWRSKRWQETGEMLERMLGERWREDTPLQDEERNDVMRAGIAYALAEDRIGLDRLRSKFSTKMLESTDARAFDTVTLPARRDTPEFSTVARRVSATDTLESFLIDYRKRFPDSPQVRSKGSARTTGAQNGAPTQQQGAAPTPPAGEAPANPAAQAQGNRG